jgi:glucokinase
LLDREQTVSDAGREIVVVDIGGTHARFARACLTPGKRPLIDQPVTLRTRDHASLSTAWDAYASQQESPLPNEAAICIAASLDSETVRLTNSPWVLHLASLAQELELDKLLLLNDYGAVAWAVAQLGDQELESICGPALPLTEEGVTTIVGPGTGLGVAQLIRRQGQIVVVETEGGHLDFAPLDSIETAIVDRLRKRFLRVSMERVVSGPGLVNLYEALAAIEGLPMQPRSDAELWSAAISGEDKLAGAALDRFVLCLGAVSGDLALAQGANQVVLTGSLVQRIKAQLCLGDFAMRFCAKGRFQSLMSNLPVRLANHPQPGLLGAAAAFGSRFMD